MVTVPFARVASPPYESLMMSVRPLEHPILVHDMDSPQANKKERMKKTSHLHVL